MPLKVNSKKETPRNLSILIALLQEGHLWFVHSGIISPTRWYSYDLHFLYTIALHNISLKKEKWMNVNENTTGPYLRFNYSDKGSVIVKYTFIK